MTTWQMLWRLLLYRPDLALANLLCWVLISLTPVALGLAARAFFDALSGGAPAMAGLWWLVILPLMLQAGRLAVTWVSVPLNVLQRFSVNALLSTNLFAQILSRPGAAALPGSPGEAISRFRDDVDEAATFVSLIRLIGLVGESITIAVVLVLMLRINAFVTLAAVAPLLAVTLVAQAAGKRINRYREQARTATGRVTGALGELFGMVQAIQLAGAESQVAEQIRRLSDRRREATVRDSLFSEVMRSIFMNTANLGTGLVLLLAAGEMQAGRFTVGDFALFAAYLGRFTLFTSQVGETMARFKQAGVSLGRMQGLMAGAPADGLVAHRPVYLSGPLPEASYPAPTPADRLEVLEARNLTYLHPVSGRGVEGIDLQVERGQVTVITGRVGSGKSTLLRALLGLLPAQAGEVRWNDRPVDDPGAHFQPPRSSYTPQVPILFSESLKENILLGLPEGQADLPEAIRNAVLEEDLAHLEAGLETQVGPRGVKLSGGQLQRTAAARMYARQPELLVVDDLSSALDVETEQRLWERLRSQQRTCLAVSHRRAALQAADRVVVLKEGRVEAQGRLEELLERSAEFRAIWSGTATE